MINAKHIAIYCRVSTERQEKEQTVQNQIGVLIEYAKNNDLLIVDKYIDDGWSGDTLARPSLDRLRNEASINKWQAVLMYDPDRLARRYSYQELVIDELKALGIDVMFITIKVPENSEDKILYGVRGLFAEYERAKISDRFRLGKLRKIKDGITITIGPYGYNYIRRTEKQAGYLEINEKEATVVRMIFIWAEQGISIRQIVKKLDEQGITPVKSKKGIWSIGRLSRLLSNPAYYGQAAYKRTVATEPERPINTDKYKRKKKSSCRIRPQDEWLFVPVPAIITKTQYDAVRLQLKTNNVRSPRNSKHNYLLGGVIYCICGGRRYCEGNVKYNFQYYKCSSVAICYPRTAKCTERMVNVEIADNVVWDKLVQLITEPKLLLSQCRKWHERKFAQISEESGKIPLIEKEKITLVSQKDRYNKIYAQGIISLDKLKEYLIPLDKRLDAIIKELANVQQMTIEEKQLPNDKEIEQFAQYTRQHIHNLNFKEKRNTALQLIDKVTATPRLLKVSGVLSMNLVYVPGMPKPRIQTDNKLVSIPFYFEVPLPQPRAQREN